jgi:hypothetical protein
VDDCDVCGELDGRIEVPGSFLLEGELVVALHVPPLLEPTPLLGHLLITPRRHADTWADLTPAEAPEIGIGCSIARRATARGDRRRADLLSRYRSPFRALSLAHFLAVSRRHRRSSSSRTSIAGTDHRKVALNRLRSSSRSSAASDDSKRRPNGRSAEGCMIASADHSLLHHHSAFGASV